MSDRTDGHTASEVAQKAMDLAKRAGVADEDQPVQPDQENIQIDPNLLAQMTQAKNSRLISMMVHENAMLEVALEQERRNSSEWKIKHDALKAAFES